MTPDVCPWLKTAATEAYLNVSRKCLYNKKDIDRFKFGIHYRVIDPKAERLTYQWNVQAIEKTMEAALDDLISSLDSESLEVALT